MVHEKRVVISTIFFSHESLHSFSCFYRYCYMVYNPLPFVGFSYFVLDFAMSFGPSNSPLTRFGGGQGGLLPFSFKYYVWLMRPQILLMKMFLAFSCNLFIVLNMNTKQIIDPNLMVPYTKVRISAFW